eukprot:CAMPEP_0113493518 /NCGR_PEP_ID=MMETSP0014_2-20120614/28632_1 /TAXON_ID=2857 /ORGANISM="Nitzschia sp." /LENGTH=581 /DNA_ID=CAMNT_0000387381 /DNA_START=240 /DNA_END=1985 /DNA_ORIENTATION=+ /assembly_acc=CAM_ASM_000159
MEKMTSSRSSLYNMAQFFIVASGSLQIGFVVVTVVVAAATAAETVTCFTTSPITTTTTRHHLSNIDTSTTRKPVRSLTLLDAVSSSSSESSESSDRNSSTGIRKSSNAGPPSYIRWNSSINANSKEWQMQTAMTTFQRGNNERVELHAQLHYGDQEYFNYWNSNSLNSRVDHVLFELLIDDELLMPLLDTNNDDQKQQQQQQQQPRVVKEPIAPSPNDLSFAQQYGWSTQVSVLDYTQPKWIHADLSRQEFISLVEEQEKQQSLGSGTKSTTNYNQQPLWQLASSSSLSTASSQSSSAASEAVSALLIGPPSLLFSTNTNDPSSIRNRRRLFTNLFLPGSTLASVLRAGLWFAVPSPELSIILLDWSSLLEPGTGTNPNALSKVAVPILSSFVRFDFTQMRRFVFGQILMSSNQSTSSSKTTNTDNKKDDDAWSLLVTKRNDHALDVLREVLGPKDDDRSNSKDQKSVALLYGSSHCPDLHQKLMRMGFQPTGTSWRTVWSVDESDRDKETFLPSLVAVLVLYLGIGALDWVGFLGDVSSSVVESNYLGGMIDASLYLGRHVLFYLGLSKFLIEWTNNDDT